MNNYIIYTDSSCDLDAKMLSELGIRSLDLTFRFNDSDKEYKNSEMNISEFYAKMVAGGVAKTSAVNSETFKIAFEETLTSGLDVLYIGFSSGLSTTYNSARTAAAELKYKYPERKILTVDSLCASAGLGLLLKLAVDMKNEGKTIEEVACFAEGLKLNVCHWFTVNDLVYLKRGGRVSAATALVGNMLGIKPVMHVDDEGHLVNVLKVRGRRAAINTLADKFGELLADAGQKIAYISHADCEEDAKLLSKTVEEKYGASVEVITNVGPVIGAHAGPGTLAFFFIGSKR